MSSEIQESLRDIERHIRWQATQFRKDCEFISGRLDKGQINDEQAQAELELAFQMYMNLFEVIRQVAFPMAREAGYGGKHLQRIQDAITLQRPVMRGKYDTYMARFMKVH